jgi:hypothetical protein
MPGARHSLGATTSSLKAEIEADVAANRGAQRDMEAAGNQAMAARMGAAADESLDELNDFKAGKWSPRP